MLRKSLLILIPFLFALELPAQEINKLEIRIPREIPQILYKTKYPVKPIPLEIEYLGDKSKKPEDKFFNKSASAIKDNLPEIKEVNEKYRLTIKIPWRENDVNIPYPKGFTKQPNPPPYDPAVAWQRSAIFPGWGQAYNQSYWKIPIFYAGYGGFVWWINFNNVRYRRFGTAYLLAIDGIEGNEDSELSARFDAEGLRTQRNQYRSRRDNAYLLLAGWHVVQIAEAYVHAHLRGFDVSEDLSMKVLPDMLQLNTGLGGTVFYPGLSFQFKF
ncbi:MAG: DUF5683 domain-containing protein [Bacteroidota bacterium]